MCAGGMGAAVATAGRSFPHLAKRRVVVAVGAKDVALAPRSGREVEDFEPVQRTLQFLVQLDVAVLRHGQRLVAMVAVQTTGLGLHILHVPAAF